MASLIVSLVACIIVGIILIIAIKEKQSNWNVHLFLLLINLVSLIYNILKVNKG